MQVIVKGRHIDLSPAIKGHAEDKLGKAIMRVFDRPAAKVEIELSDLGNMRDGLNKECRVTVFMPKGKTINISEVSDDMYKAIDLAHDRLLHQVKRARTKKVVTTRNRKEAEKMRAQTARDTLTTEPEGWEEDLQADLAEGEPATASRA